MPARSRSRSLTVKLRSVFGDSIGERAQLAGEVSAVRLRTMASCFAQVAQRPWATRCEQAS